MDADPLENTVYGWAKQGASILVFGRHHLTEEAFLRFETADENGFWLADFSEPGYEPGEGTICNIEDFSFCIVAQADKESDMTAIWFQPSQTSQPILRLARPNLLVKAYGTLRAAANELGYNSVKELQVFLKGN
ncbi:hypothetical protein ACFLTQ_03310 [Chloroflexota bacterium]